MFQMKPYVFSEKKYNGIMGGLASKFGIQASIQWSGPFRNANKY